MDKIKAIDPKIVVNSNVNKPYYSIEYYDTAANKWHIGYGSYELTNVVEWLKTDFDVIEAEVEPIVYCEDCKHSSKNISANWCGIWNNPIPSNFYCKFGKKMEDIK